MSVEMIGGPLDGQVIEELLPPYKLDPGSEHKVMLGMKVKPTGVYKVRECGTKADWLPSNVASDTSARKEGSGD